MQLIKKISIFVTQIFCCIACFAQTHTIDSLKHLLPSLKGEARIDCLNEVCYQYVAFECNSTDYSFRYLDSVLSYANTSYQDAKDIKYIDGLALASCLKATFYGFLKNFPDDEKLARESLKWFGLTNNKKRIEIAYFQLGASLFSQYRYDEAAGYLEQLYQRAEKNRNPEWMFNVLAYRYENYRDIGEYDKAFEAFQKTQQLKEQLYGKRDSIYDFYVLAEMQRRVGNYAIALNYYRKVIASMDLQNENIWYRVSYPELFALNAQFDSARYYYNLIDSSKLTKHDLRFYLVSIGEFYLTQREYKKALDHLLHGLQYHLEAKDMAQTNRALLNISKAYLALDDVQNSLLYAHKGLDIALASRSKQYMQDGYQLLYEIYQRMHEPDSSFLYYKKYVTQKELVAGDVLKGQFAAYDYELKITSLDKEKLWQQKQIEQTLRQKQFLISGIIFLFILGFVVFRNILLKRKNEANRRRMAETELQIQKLESKKVKAEFQQQTTELEMQALRAQMNPHFIFNCLSSINRYILINRTEEASDYLTKFSRLIRMALHNSEKSFITLENELEALRLYLDLERLRFRNAFNFQITCINSLDESSIFIPPMLIQPFAENAIWHGLMHKEGIGSLDIVLSAKGKTLTCSVTDDGIGRDKAAAINSKSAEKNKSMGVKVTSKRLELLSRNENEQAIFTIKDLVDHEGNSAGTKVILQIRYKSLEDF